jgi:hypothetical protein
MSERLDVLSTADRPRRQRDVAAPTEVGLFA